MMFTFWRRPEFWITFGLSIIFAVILFFTFQFINPAPPRTLAIASGSPGGFYDSLGSQYAERLTEEGLEITVIPSAGTAENIGLLEQTDGGAQVAFVQGGVAEKPRKSDLVSLGSIALEPLWIFTRKNGAPLTRLAQLKGRTVAVGPEGSGTRPLALSLIEAAVEEGDRPSLSDLGGRAAADALQTGEIDAAFFVTAPSTVYIQTLLADPNILLVNLERANALQQQFSFLSLVPVPQGALDLYRNIPPEDFVLLAPATTLVARSNVHPAIISLVLDVANAMHRDEAIFGMVGAFPSEKYTDFKLSAEARRYFEFGPSFLRRYVPFWAANVIERLWVLIIPLITIMIPLMRVAPPAYRWQIRRRIYVWYEDLRELETQWWAAEDEARREELLLQIDKIRDDVNRLKIPVAYADELYHLRMHIAFVKAMMAEGVRRA